MSPDAHVVEYVVVEGKREIARHRVIVEGAQVSIASANDLEPAVTFTLSPALADSVAHATVGLDVAFMRGAAKMSGDYSVLLRVLPALGRTSGLPIA